MPSFAHPAALLLGPLAVLLLWLLERWRRRPPRLVVADLALFAPDAEVAAEARTRRRRAGTRWLLRAGATLSLTLAAAGLRLPPGPGGPLLVDLALDRGPSADARGPGGETRLARRQAALEEVLARLRPDDRVRVHLLPAGAGPAPPPLAPATARELLARVTPVGAPARLELALPALAPASGPPAFVAADALPLLPATVAGRVRLAASGGRCVDRALVALRQDPAGAVWVTVASRGAPGLARVTLRAGGADGAEVTRTGEVELPASGQALLRFTPDALPPAVTWLEAHLEGADALPLDDAAYAVRQVRPRQVGVVGDPGPWVRRALRAVPDVVVRELARLDRAGAAELDLALLPGLGADEPLPGVPVALIPPALPAAPAPGGVLEALAAPGLERTAESLSREPATLTGAGPLARLPEARPLLRLRGGAPVATLSGSGRRLVVAFAFPLRREVTTWTELPGFPIFWGELLALVAPREGAGELAAHPAGEPWDGPEGTSVPLQVGWERAPDGRRLLGTVAALPPEEPPGEPAPSRFAAADLEALDAARAPARERPLAAWCLLLAAGLALAAWRTPAVSADRGA